MDKSTIGRAVNYLVGIMLFVLWGFIAFYLFIDPRINTVVEQSHKLTLERQGVDSHVFSVQRHVCASDDLRFTLKGELHGPLTYSLPVVMGTLQGGCHGYVYARVLPALPDGTYDWISNYEFCNALSCFGSSIPSVSVVYSNGVPTLVEYASTLTESE